MSKQNECPEINLTHVSKECDCNYMPPPVSKLLVRKNKKGQIQVKVNGKGKWIDAELEGNILRFIT